MGAGLVKVCGNGKMSGFFGIWVDGELNNQKKKADIDK